MPQQFVCVRRQRPYLRLSQLTVLLLILSASIGVTQSTDNATITVVMDPSTVYIGENVTVTCRVSSSEPDGATGLQWRKSSASDDSNEEIIAVDDKLTSLYSQFGNGRYEIVRVPLLQGVTLYILHIFLVKFEDSGRIRCSYPSRQYTRENDFSILHVYKRLLPGDVQFDNFADGAELTVVENTPVSVTCRAQRVLPQPNISIHIHNRSLGNHLPTKVKVNVYCPVEIGYQALNAVAASSSKTCPVHYDLDVAVTVPDLVAMQRDDGHRVTCSAELPHANWTPVVTSLNLNVQYRPRFNCSRSVSTQLHARDVIIRCRLRFNPRPSQLSVRWQHSGDIEQTTIDVGSAIGNKYRLDETVIDAKTWKETEMIFSISEVHHKDITDYHFVAINEVGSTTHSVHLIRRDPPRPKFTTTNKPTTVAFHMQPTMHQTSDDGMPTGNGAASVSWPASFILALSSIASYTRQCHNYYLLDFTR